MLELLAVASIRYRHGLAVALLALFVVGFLALRRLPIDAMPDVSTVQVAVLTSAPGLSATEVERAVTAPVENALNGVPHGVELRSTSRYGLSAVVQVFADGTDPWFCRQLVLERLRGIERELPPSAGTPELGPVSSGLGEIYQFLVRSDHHSPMQLRTLLDWEIVPKLRSVPGVTEVNTQGGDLKQFHIVVDPASLQQHHLTLGDVVAALRAAHMNVGGGYVERGQEAFTVRGQGMLHGSQEIESVVIRSDSDGTPVLVRNVAQVKEAAALRHGVITHNGEGEAVTGIVMMLLGANSNDVVKAVAARVAEIRSQLPAGVSIETVYDRADFVGRTIQTVVVNLVEGILIVMLVLALFLGTLRGALAVVLGIPAAMSIALLGMHWFGVTGDLMSLGAIDFGFLVDGPIVILEAAIAATAGRRLVADARAQAYAEVARSVVRPVGFSVAIIMLVYLPLLSLEGIEGKMFRPMALTMACALFGALVYAIVFFPAVLTLLVAPPRSHGPAWLEHVSRGYARILPAAVRWRWVLLLGSIMLLMVVGWRFAGAGAEFVPRIFEGDAMVTIRRAPSISLPEARELDLACERILRRLPEVTSALAMTGRAEVAIDPVGNDNTDILIRLRPREEWTNASDFDELSARIKADIECEVTGTFVSVSQPIEDKTNELISGSRADVAIQIYGRDLERLAQLADDIGRRVKSIRGSGDVRTERILGEPILTATPDRRRMARYGVRLEDAFHALSASREGIPVGTIYEDHKRFEMRVLVEPGAPTAEALGQLYVPTSTGKSVPLSEVLTFAEGEGPTAIRRIGRERVVRVDVNLRGRDLLSWVQEAKAVVASEIPLDTGYRIEWGGQFENFERASARLAIVVPVVVAIILGMLFWMFGTWRITLAVFLTVPFSLTGGMLGLLWRDLGFSLSAAVGFIALGGIAVLNGMVMASEVLRLVREGVDPRTAVVQGSAHVVRAVLTTGTVAALGFLPMALATSAGSEVQRPLATVVVIGELFGTLVALLVLPGLLHLALAGTGTRMAAPLAERPAGEPTP
jgi:cobalt-zinc-cadmium resistance protein CzcA